MTRLTFSDTVFVLIP